MTGRERLNAILRKQPKDRLSWAANVDGNSLSQLPGEMQKFNMIDFSRYLGADVFALNNGYTQHGLRSPELRCPDFLQQTDSCDPTDPNCPEIWSRKWTIPKMKGELVRTCYKGRTIKFPVDSIQAIRLYRKLWEGATYLAQDDSISMKMLETLVGDDGVITRFWGPSTIPRLLEEDMGIENFYLLNFDYPDEMDGLIRIMHERELQAFEHLAAGPWESATLCENTSTAYISPEIYEKYNMPHQRDFVNIMHRAGKPAILHMCGHLLALLDLIKETGCDGIHALTPPPTGNTPWEKALDVIGEDLVILSCLDPTVWVSGKIEQIGPELDRLVTPRLREANFVLGIFADGIPVPLERFEAVQHWMERNT